MRIFSRRASRGIRGVFLLTVVSAPFIPPHTAAAAGLIGTPGPYSVTIKDAVNYAAPASDTVIECKPTAVSGHFAGPFPAMLLVHGGGWDAGTNAVDGSTYTSAATWCQLWASWGFETFSVGYRFTKTAPWPAQMVDLQAAIRWVRANAVALNVNRGLVGVNGDSAGGQMAMIAGYSTAIISGDLAGDNAYSNPRATLVISQFGPWTWGPSAPSGAPSVRAEDYASQMLLDHADGRSSVNTPNTLFVQGLYDTTVYPCSQSVAADVFLRSNDRPASYISYPGGHEFSGMDTSTWGTVVGGIQLQTISFAYKQAHSLAVLPASETGPGLTFSDASLPSSCS
jgi:acetyl esterase/lipase